MKKSFDLDAAASELEVATPTITPVKLDSISGPRGSMDSMESWNSLPSVTIVGDPDNGGNSGWEDVSFGSQDFGNSASASASGGGNGSGSADTDDNDQNSDGSNIKDPNGILEQFKNNAKVKSSLDKIRSSNLQVHIQELPSDNKPGYNGSTHYDSVTGEIVVEYEEGCGVDLIEQELAHIEQIIDGELWIENGNITGYDIYDEVDSFQAGHDALYGTLSGWMDLDGNVVNGGGYVVTPDEIRQLDPEHYGNLPNYRWNRPSTGTTPPLTQPVVSASSIGGLGPSSIRPL